MDTSTGWARPAAGNGPQSARVILVLALRSAFSILSAKLRRAANLDERVGATRRG